MTEEVSPQQPGGERSRAISSSCLRNWWQLGLWTDVEGLQGSWEASSQSLPPPLPAPHVSGLKVNPGPMEAQYRWRLSPHRAHLLASEISLRIGDSFLEVTGKHEERPGEHGFAARCFTWKYRLPVEADPAMTVSTLSADGILRVEAPVPESSAPAFTIIPIKVEMEEQKGKGCDEFPGDGRAPEHPDFPASDDYGEVLQLEDPSDHGQPGNTANGLQQDEETFGEPAGESHPSEPADGRSSESLQEEGRGTEQPEAELYEPELSLGGGPQSEEDQKQNQEQEDQKQDQEQEDQKQEDQKQEQEDQKQEDQELEDQKQDQEQEDQKQEDQELEDQKQDQEQEDQKQDQEQEHQKQDQEDQKQDQKLEDQEQEDRKLKDQKQDQELEDQKQEDRKLEDQKEDQEQKEQNLEDQEQEDRKLEDQEQEDRKLEDQEQEDQKLEDQKQEDRKLEDQDLKQESTE